MDACERLIRVFYQPPKYQRERAKKFLPVLHEKFGDFWRTRAARTPESLNNMTLEESLALLRTLDGVEGLEKMGEESRNATRFVALGKNNKAVVKRDSKRYDYSDTKVYTYQNNVRREILAFVLDRYLGTNLVPPTVLLANGMIAELFIRARETKLSKAAAPGTTFLDFSHMRLLDLLMGNGDRHGTDNLMAEKTDTGEVGKLVAIDFDMSKAVPTMPVEAATHALYVAGVVVEPNRSVSKTALLPGIFGRIVFAKLQELNQEKAIEIAEAAGLKLTQNELQALMAAKHAAVKAIEKFIAEFGEDLILIDQG